jgi:hypothetical protein
VAPRVARLTVPRRVTRRFILQKARGQGCPLPRFVSQRFQGLFHSPRRGAFHRSLTVLFAIGRWMYLALGRGRPGFRRDVACPAVLKIRDAGSKWSPTGLSPAVVACSKRLWLTVDLGNCVGSSTGPRSRLPTRAPQGRAAWHGARLGCSRFARRYYGNGVCSSGYVRCFSSPGALVTAYVFSGASAPITAQGLPHSEMAGSQPDSGSPAHIGGSPRPSSASIAKASIAGFPGCAGRRASAARLAGGRRQVRASARASAPQK